MVEKKPQPKTNPGESLPDSDSSDDEQVNPRLRTSTEERDYGTIRVMGGATRQPTVIFRTSFQDVTFKP